MRHLEFGRVLFFHLVSRIPIFFSFGMYQKITSKGLITGVDVVLDNMGGPYFQRNLDSLNVDGRLFIIGFMGGTVSEVNLAGLLARRLTVQGMFSSPCPYVSGLWSYLYNTCKLELISLDNVIRDSVQNIRVNQFSITDDRDAVVF